MISDDPPEIVSARLHRKLWYQRSATSVPPASTLARAAAIPARFASVYAPYVTPQDFHAVAEVFLDGTWHLVDATGMAAPNQIVRIGVGMDAAEVPFLSSFGPAYMRVQTVDVQVVQ